MEEKFIISIETNEKLSKEEIIRVICDLKSRLEGYQTEPIPEISGAEMGIGYYDEPRQSNNKLIKVIYDKVKELKIDDFGYGDNIMMLLSRQVIQYSHLK